MEEFGENYMDQASRYIKLLNCLRQFVEVQCAQNQQLSCNTRSLNSVMEQLYTPQDSLHWFQGFCRNAPRTEGENTSGNGEMAQRDYENKNLRDLSGSRSDYENENLRDLSGSRPELAQEIVEDSANRDHRDHRVRRPESFAGKPRDRSARDQHDENQSNEGEA
jgi:hypothetical protein